MLDRPRPTITIANDGPYLVRGVDTLLNHDGNPLPTTSEMALCRCGHAATKPFCDGVHAKRDFDGALRTDFPAKRNYEGRTVTVHYNRALCAHIGHCTARLSAVFNVKVRPWISPDDATTADVIETVAGCPSGALSCTGDHTVGKDPIEPPAIRLLRNGPLAVTGGVVLADAPRVDGASPNRYTLCRCGSSRSMPFCDGAHAAVGFRDDTDERPGVGSDSADDVATSFRRGLMDGHFLDSFYDTILSESEPVAALFAHTDLSVQKPLLRAAIDVMIRYGSGDTDAQTDMERLAKRHAHADLNIDPAYYRVWLEVLCRTLRRHDPEFSPALEAAWRARMQPGIDLMVSEY